MHEIMKSQPGRIYPAHHILSSLIFSTCLKKLLAIQYEMKLSTSANLLMAAISMMSMPKAASSAEVQMSSSCV